MGFEYRTNLTTPNRWAGGNARVSVTFHHFGDPSQYANKRTAATAVADFFMSETAGVSAHFVISHDLVYCLAACSDRTWSTGTRAGNNSTIAIELNPHADPANRESAAMLLAVLWHWYPHLAGKTPLPHSSWVPTTCPGKYLGLLTQIRDRAAQLYPAVDPDHPGKLKADGAAPVGKYPKSPATASAARLAPDGYWGTETTRVFQQFFGTPADGLVSSQPRAWRGCNPGLTSGWEWTDQPAGSALILHLQKLWNMPAPTCDGLIGPATIKAMQTYYKTPIDGRLDGPSPAIAALQRIVNSRFSKGK